MCMHKNQFSKIKNYFTRIVSRTFSILEEFFNIQIC